MTLQEYFALPDAEKILINEIKLARPLHSEAWTSPSGSGEGNVYNIAFEDGEIVSLEVDGVALVEEFSLADVVASPSPFSGSWYFDKWNERLYLNLPDGDSPETLISSGYKYTIIASFWLGFVNRKDGEKGANFEREEQILDDPELDYWDSSSVLRYWTEDVTSGSTIEKSTDVWNDEESAFSLKITVGGGGELAGVFQSVRLAPQSKYIARLYHKNEASGSIGKIMIRDSGSNVYLNSSGEWVAAPSEISLPSSVAWTEYELALITHPLYTEYVFEILSDDPSAVIYFDFVRLFRIRLASYYKALIAESSIPDLDQSVGDFYISDERLSFGDIELINDGSFYVNRTRYIWHNRESIVKIGAISSEYDELGVIFEGLTRDPEFSDDGFRYSLKDPKIRDLIRFPSNRYDPFTFPNIEESRMNTERAFLLGPKSNITPVCIDTASFIYEVSQTEFFGVVYELEAIDAVYKDGTALVAGVGYTTDLANGRFTLAADPGDSVITCDAKGLKIDFESWDYSYNIADFIFFIFCIINQISPFKINVASLLDLKTNRTQYNGCYFGSSVETTDFLRIARQGSLFQSYYHPSGKYIFRRYIAGYDDETPRFRGYDIADIAISEPTDQAFKRIVLAYDQDPTTSNWLNLDGETPQTEYKYREKSELRIETYLVVEAEAESILEIFLRLVRNPPRELRATINSARALLLNPTDKGVFSKSVVLENIGEFDVLSEEVYRILEMRKNPNSAVTEIVAISDLDAAGYSAHNDSPHEDYHEDSHADAHEDGAHADAHTDAAHADYHVDSHTDQHQDYHTDVAHLNAAHQDTHLDSSHCDVHQDTAYIDSYTDSHSDHYTDSYSDHSDGALHTDRHSDSHLDSYSDVHTDTAHLDYHCDDPHFDTHLDVAHQDEPHSQSHLDSHNDVHGDTHGDFPHADVHSDGTHADSHSDSYSDYHEDEIHLDSYY